MSEDRDRWSRFLSAPIDEVAARVMTDSWIARRFGTYEILIHRRVRAGMGEVYRATRELVHNHEHPVAPEHDGFAPTEVHAPQEAVFRVA